MGSEFTGDTTMDAAEKRLNELGYKQELRREMTMFKTLAISFSTMTLFTGITPLYGSSLQYAGPASLVWGWVVVSFFTWFVGIAMAEICSSFPTTGSLYFWAAHLAGPKWGPFSSWCCAWLETIGLIAGIGTQAYAGSQTLQSIILLSTGTNKGGGYFAPKWLFLCMYIGLTVIWAALNTFALEVIALIDMISIWWQNFSYLYDTNNETAGAFVPAQILYDAFHGRYHNSIGAIILLFIIWGSFFFGGLSITTSAARVVYALSRDNGVPFSSLWRKLHPKRKVPSNAVWLCAGICILLGLPILKVNVVFTAITSICTIGWVGGYAVPIFARMVMPEKNFKPGPFYLGKAGRPICLIAFLWICYTCSVFLLPTLYPITWNTFNYAPVALGVVLGLIMLWWVVDARKWFKGPVRNIDTQNGKV
ncbi:amino-acid permease BAT1 homolog isoform X2 [Arachis hypogaea]|uniref:amino-acid permease BAT1 homolog isoform X2 n=1 Tax=Arachis hypogaea TaxID=3818 RepID=UPI000DEC9E07|nr:amino-acid permease BAT1 homolog isoform X2 [Arachis hypogaea]